MHREIEICSREGSRDSVRVEEMQLQNFYSIFSNFQPRKGILDYRLVRGIILKLKSDFVSSKIMVSQYETNFLVAHHNIISFHESS
jgi:hypothetical protein